MNGASAVILTDYPDHSLIQTLETNVRANLTGHALTRTKVQGYIWGTDTVDLMEDGPFDLVIMSDLVFNHSQHDALLRTCAQVLRPTSLQAKDNLLQTPCVLVFFTHHRPWLAEKDTEFLEKAKGNGWECERIMENYTGPMFKDDPGDERVRGTVHGWRMWRR
ncbi:nicotinamide n-methyltransferase [Serendipita sp. 396]|nr:nicotinamide n-methyltransferase [Serendipita sp. 396]KAG8824760.1 nicotinamide n-methyltransferase [Serendipita sp. 400]